MFRENMNSRYIWVVLLMMVASCAFAQEEQRAAKGTDNVLVVSSMDGEQVTTLLSEEARIFWAVSIDTSVFHADIEGYSLSEEYGPYLRGDVLPHLDGEVPDSSRFVIKINNVELGFEDEPMLLLYGQFDEGLLTKVYYVGVCQNSWAWKGVNTYLAVLRQDGRPRVKLDAVLETIRFGLAWYVKHPYNEEGVYDDIHRYQRIHAEFEVPEDVFKLLGQAAEPPVKPVERETPVDTNDADR